MTVMEELARQRERELREPAQHLAAAPARLVWHACCPAVVVP
jgi:hypothetical protein